MFLASMLCKLYSSNWRNLKIGTLQAKGKTIVSFKNGFLGHAGKINFESVPGHFHFEYIPQECTMYVIFFVPCCCGETILCRMGSSRYKSKNEEPYDSGVRKCNASFRNSNRRQFRNQNKLALSGPYGPSSLALQEMLLRD